MASIAMETSTDRGKVREERIRVFNSSTVPGTQVLLDIFHRLRSALEWIRAQEMS